jgi:transposase-like protein
MLIETRDMVAAEAFLRSAKAVTGITPTQITTDGHGSYPRAIRSELGSHVRHRTSRYLTDVFDKTFPAYALSSANRA